MSKFSNNIAEYLYQLALDGGHDEECGSCTDGDGWFAKFEGPIDAEPGGEFDLSGDSVAALRSCAGAVLAEDTEGFVGCELFSDASDFLGVWFELMDAADDSTVDVVTD